MAHAHPPAAGHAHSLDARRADSRRRMLVALCINVALLAAEVVGGILTGSLALLADAGHVLSDVGAIALALAAVALASRPAAAHRTFGYQRGEVFAALVNGLALVVVSVLIVVEAASRFGDPPDVAGTGVLVLGLAGLAGNLAATAVLARGQREDLNLEGVLRHSLADALGSVGVVVSGIVILTSGWEAIDPAVSLLIAGLILISSWRLIVEPVNVLMEAAPPGIDVAELGRTIAAADHVLEVHDLHVWTVTPGFPALAAHVEVDPGCDRDMVRLGLQQLLRERYGIEHTTLQMVVEPRGGPIGLG